MDCTGTSERLPWLVGGGLPAAEADEVRAHLATCPRCREELAETRRAAAVFGAHVPVAVLMDLAWDRTPSAPDAALAASHLASCPECREELELARESRRLEADAQERPRAVRWNPSWLAVPASLAAGLVLGFGLWGRGPAPVTPPDPRVALLEQETSRLRGMVQALERAASTARPRINLPLFELVPPLVRRGGASQATEIAVPAGAAEIALLASSEAPAGTSASLAILGADGREVWRTEELVSGPPGGYLVTVPAEMLPAGVYSIRLQPKSGARVDYRVRVRR